jgi:hypothetical protein
MGKESICLLLQKLLLSTKTSNVRTVGLSVLHDTAKDERGRHIYYKTCSHTVVHIEDVIIPNSSTAVAGSGPNMKRLIVSYGGAQNTYRPCIAPTLVWKTIFGRNILAVFPRIR